MPSESKKAGRQLIFKRIRLQRGPLRHCNAIDADRSTDIPGICDAATVEERMQCIRSYAIAIAANEIPRHRTGDDVTIHAIIEKLRCLSKDEAIRFSADVFEDIHSAMLILSRHPWLKGTWKCRIHNGEIEIGRRLSRLTI